MHHSQTPAPCEQCIGTYEAINKRPRKKRPAFWRHSYVILCVFCVRRHRMLMVFISLLRQGLCPTYMHFFFLCSFGLLFCKKKPKSRGLAEQKSAHKEVRQKGKGMRADYLPWHSSFYALYALVCVCAFFFFILFYYLLAFLRLTRSPAHTYTPNIRAMAADARAAFATFARKILSIISTLICLPSE